MDEPILKYIFLELFDFVRILRENIYVKYKFKVGYFKI